MTRIVCPCQFKIFQVHESFVSIYSLYKYHKTSLPSFPLQISIFQQNKQKKNKKTFSRIHYQEKKTFSRTKILKLCLLWRLNQTTLFLSRYGYTYSENRKPRDSVVSRWRVRGSNLVLPVTPWNRCTEETRASASCTLASLIAGEICRWKKTIRRIC